MTGNPQPPRRDVAAEWAVAESVTGGVRRPAGLVHARQDGW